VEWEEEEEKEDNKKNSFIGFDAEMTRKNRNALKRMKT